MFVRQITYKDAFSEWIKGMSDPIDEQSKKKAYELYDNSILQTTEVGTVKGLQQNSLVHSDYCDQYG